MARTTFKTIGPVCVECGSETKVTETRKGDATPIMLYRTRKCKDPKCSALFTTLEIYAPNQQIPHQFRAADKIRKRQASND